MISINFDPFPVIDTERLLLRRLTTGDLDGMFALRSNPEVMQFVPRPIAKTQQDAMDIIAMIEQKVNDKEGINWVITLKGNQTFMGVIGHHRIRPEQRRAELGYMLLPEFQGNGYISEAISRVVTYGFDEMNLHSIEAIIDPANHASARVLEKNNFEREAHLKENEFFDGRFIDTVIYSLLARNHNRS